VVGQRTFCFEDGSHQPVAHRQDGRWLHYVNDASGAPSRLVDARGAVACSLERRAWGRTRFEAGSTASTPIRFQGQYEDAETGLCYNRWRYFDPDLAQFIAADPVRLRGGVHLYAYGPNPLSYIDPLGLAATRRQAEAQAQGHAQVPRDSRGGQDIPMSDLNESSRGRNWGTRKAAGETSMGRRCDSSQLPGDQRHWEDHMDGHPDAGQPGVPAHHGEPHIHSVNARGEEIVITYDP
jgi:RHS repeat-associated protein